MDMISFKDVTFTYASLDEPTLSKVSFSIKKGEKVLITGRSGSGKSTIAHLINGLIPFNYKGKIEGEIRVNGQVPSEKSLFEMGLYVGTILQDQDCQFVGLDAGEDVAFSFENDCVPTEKMHVMVDEALEKMDMLEHKKVTPQNLSGGQKQKISIAGMLAMKTDILLFDEPLANLDPASGERAMETIDSLNREEKKTIVVIEHRIEEVLEHDFDRVIVVENGMIAFNGSPDKLLAEGRLRDMGLREPLYVTAIRFCGGEISEEDGISKWENALKFKEKVLSAYEDGKVEEITSRKDTVLRLENICYKYYKEDPYTIENISFDIHKGEILAIVGNNGAGKSTLLKTISGIAKYQEGHMYFNGECIDDWSIGKRAASVGFVMQNPNHMITKTMIWDEVAFGPSNMGLGAEEINKRTESALRTCGLYEYRKWPINALSYGQKKRLTIASIIAMGSELIVLDEPTAGQDYTSYVEFMAHLNQIKNMGTAIVIITHDMHLALEYADRGIVLSGGKLIAEDSMESILSRDEIIEQAALKHTSIERLGRLYQVENLSSFINYFTKHMGGDSND